MRKADAVAVMRLESWLGTQKSSVDLTSSKQTAPFVHGLGSPSRRG